MYDNIHAHLAMLADRVRTVSFDEALKQTVRPGTTVLDFGCGSGILSFFAARAGADRVYAVDRSRFIRAARELARANGLDNIEFFHGDHTIDLPGKVDLIVSEWMGNFLFHEQMLEPLLRLRDRWLKPGGVMVPERLELRCALVTDTDLRDELDLFQGRAYDLDFSMVADWPAHNVLTRQYDTSQVMEPAVSLGSLEMTSCTGTPAELSGTALPTRDAVVQGVCGWFDAEIAEDVTFGTGPFDPPTHWWQLVFPLGEPLAVREGEPVEIGIRPRVTEDGEDTRWSWSVEADGERREMNDTPQREWVERPLGQGKLE